MKNFGQEQTAYITLPITPGNDPNLLTGGYSITATPEELTQITKGQEVVGPGASENLQNEITARNGEFIRIPADGNIQAMQPDDGIAFGHMSAFVPTNTGSVKAHNRAELGRKLQQLLGGHIGSLTAKLEQATFNILLVRTPNHSCSPAPHIKEALKDEVHFYFLYHEQAAENARIYYNTLLENEQLAHTLGFVKDGDKFIKTIQQSSQHDKEASLQEVEINKIIIRPGDQLFIHNTPLEMTTVIQYADYDMYEMGGAAGWHMHTDGTILIGNDVIRVGGHILGFVGLQHADAAIMPVTSTYIKENEEWRKAWGRENLGMRIATEACSEHTPIDVIKAVSHTVSPHDYQDDIRNRWTSYIRDHDKREHRTTQLVDKTKQAIATKTDFLTSDTFVNALKEQRKAIGCQNMNEI